MTILELEMNEAEEIKNLYYRNLKNCQERNIGIANAITMFQNAYADYDKLVKRVKASKA